MLSFIVAMDKNNVIGMRDTNKMPWHLPKDLQYFKERTSGHTIVMGRKTFDSLGRVLPNRKHIVLTKSNHTFPDEVAVIHDFKEVLALATEYPDEEIFIIGGGSIFEQFISYVDKLYVTTIDETFEGDVYFPEINPADWTQVNREKGDKDDRNPYDYYFTQYVRKQI